MTKYWNNAGTYQTELDAMSTTLVPHSGACDTLGGEVLRGAMKLYYDAFNNGFLNNTSGAAIFLNLCLLPNFKNEDYKELKDSLDLIIPLTNTDSYSTITKYVELALDTIVDYAVRFNIEYTKIATLPSDSEIFDHQEDDFYEDEDEDSYWCEDDFDENGDEY